MPTLIKAFINSIPVFLLSVFYLLKWIDDANVSFFENSYAERILEVEGFVLFFAIFVYGTMDRSEPKKTLLALGSIGAVALIFSLSLKSGGASAFWMMMVIHLIGSVSGSTTDRARQGIVLFVSLPLLWGTSIISFSDWMWGTLYFGLQGVLLMACEYVKYPESWNKAGDQRLG